MVFSSVTFLFLFLPVVLFFYWLPDVILKIIQFFSRDERLEKRDNGEVERGYFMDCHADKSARNDVNSTKLVGDNKNNNYNNYNKKQEQSGERPLQSLRDSSPTIRGGASLNRKYKNLVLLAFSILFYAWGEPAFVLVMLLSIFINYLLGRLIDKYRNHDKALLWTSVVFNLGILFIFKYLCFTLQNIGCLISKDFSSIKIALPIGISFFTFQAIQIWR